MTRRGRPVRIIAVAASITWLLSGCGTSGDTTGADPLSGGSVDQGRTLFANNCAVCHGPDLRGTQQGPPLIHEFYVPGHHGDAAFLAAVQRGVRPHHWNFGAMPPIASLSIEEVADIVSYVRQEQRDAGLIE